MSGSGRPPGGLGPPIAFAACCLIWGSTFLVIRIGNDSVPPLWGASLRLALAAAILAPLARATGARLPRGDALQAAIAYGALSFGISFPLLYWGETAVPSGLTAVLYATIPLSSAVFTHALGLERLGIVKLAGAVIALAGVAVIFAGQIHGVIPPLPFLALLGAATTASLGTVLLKRGPRQSALAVNAVGALAGLPLCLGASVLLGESHRWPVTAAALGPILYLALAGSVGAFVIMSWLVHRWPVTRVSFISVVVPVVALLLGGLVLHEPLAAGGLAGALLVVAGVGLGIASDRRRAARRGVAGPPAPARDDARRDPPGGHRES